MKGRLASSLRNRTGLDSAFQEIDEEIAFHLETLTQDLLARGLSEQEARDEARRRFGSVLRTRTACRRLAVKEMLMQKRTLIITCSILALLVVVGGFLCFALYQQVRVQREVAMVHAMEAREMAMEAERQRQVAEAANAFLVEMFTAVDPAAASSREVTVREVLDAAAKRLDSGAINDSHIESEVRRVIEDAKKKLETEEKDGM